MLGAGRLNRNPNLRDAGEMSRVRSGCRDQVGAGGERTGDHARSRAELRLRAVWIGGGRGAPHNQAAQIAVLQIRCGACKRDWR